MKRILKWGCSAAILLLAIAFLGVGCFIYSTKYKVRIIASSLSYDRQYELLYQSVGAPDWPFGYSHARLVLKKDGRTITKYPFDVANDGGLLYPNSWRVVWKENCVETIISGEEQPDILYVLSFDGKVHQESPHMNTPDPEESAYVESPLEITVPDFSEFVTENENGESVFSLSINDFINYYNYVYQKTHGTGYLKSADSENWVCYDDLSPCLGYSSKRTRFLEDKNILSQPTISLYPSKTEEIYEIRLTFDDHGFRDTMFERFKELSLCMEQTLMPDLPEMERETLYDQLCMQASTNFFGDHTAFDDPERPALNTVYRYGNIGIVSFYGTGNLEICFIPLTVDSVAFLQKNGITLNDLEYSSEQ